jgi:hypothetical protein
MLMQIGRYEEDRKPLLLLFRLADASPFHIARNFLRGEVPLYLSESIDWMARRVRSQTETARTGTKLQIPSEIRTRLVSTPIAPIFRCHPCGSGLHSGAALSVSSFRDPIADICLRIAILLVLRPRMQHKSSMRVAASRPEAAMPKAGLRKRTAAQCP